MLKRLGLNSDSNIMLLLRLARQFENVALLGTGMVAGYVLAGAGGVGFAEWLRTVTGELNETHKEGAHWIALSLVGYLVLRGVGNLIGTYSASRITTDLAHKMRIKLFHKALKVPMERLHAQGVGQWSMLINMICNQASMNTLNLLKILLRDGMQAVWLFAYLLYLSWEMTLLLFVSLPVVATIFAKVTNRIRNATQAAQTLQGGVAQQVTEVITGIQVVKIFQGEARESENFKEASKNIVRMRMQLVLAEAVAIPLVQVLTGLVAAAITWLSLAEITASLSGEDFVAYFAALGLLFTPLRQMASFGVKLQMCAVAAQTIFNFLEEGEEMREGDALPENIGGNLVAKNLSFSYPNGTKALRDISFTLKPGTTTALVGHSGSGKTTITSLLCGFYRGWGGELSFGGHNLQDVSVIDIRRNIATVNQDVVLFTGTLADNIAYGYPDASRQEIEDAARRADAWDFIGDLQEGLDTEVGPGGAVLSGGQKQRISIARALLTDAPILILDEATASLDNISERKIQRVLQELMRGRITLVISHRLQFVREADEILVLKQGEIVERGSHQQLLERGEHYAALYEYRDEQQPPELPEQDAEIMLDEQAMQTLQLPLASSRAAPSAAPPRRGFSLTRSWYRRSRWLWLLAPASLLMYLLWAVRRLLYTPWLKKARLKKAWHLPVPTVVVGNLTAGGTGKTPFITWIAKQLMARGIKVGIVSRGYGGKSNWYPLAVEKDTSVLQAGDEAWLLHQELGCPVVVGPDRLQAAAELLQRYPCDLLLSDDGLQHMRLGRSAEIVMLDAKRRFGNGMMLPAGPLREPRSRLKKVLYAVTKDGEWDGKLPCPSYSMKLRPVNLVHLASGERTSVDQWLWNKRVHACAAIGNPASFFDSLRRLGFEVVEHPFPDHHVFAIKDLVFADSLPLVMTQKDACKCEHMDLPHAWYLEVQTEVSGGEEMVDRLLQQLNLADDDQFKLPAAASQN